MIDADDRELVHRFLRDCDEAAFVQLYRRHTPALAGTASRLLGARHADLADVVQDTWWRAAVALPRFEWRSAFRTWLVGIAVNCCRERLKVAGLSAVEGPSVDDLAAPPIASTTARVDLARALGELPHGYREVLVLHDIEGYTHEEIGGMLGVAAGTSKSQLARARRAMRRLLAPLQHAETGIPR